MQPALRISIVRLLNSFRISIFAFLVLCCPISYLYGLKGSFVLSSHGRLFSSSARDEVRLDRDYKNRKYMGTIHHVKIKKRTISGYLSADKISPQYLRLFECAARNFTSARFCWQTRIQTLSHMLCRNSSLSGYFLSSLNRASIASAGR